MLGGAFAADRAPPRTRTRPWWSEVLNPPVSFWPIPCLPEMNGLCDDWATRDTLAVGNTVAGRLPATTGQVRAMRRARRPATPTSSRCQTRSPRLRSPLRTLLDPVYRYCYRSLSNREAAEDATSLVFSRALAALPGCDPRSFRSWLFAIAHNTLANTVRDRRITASLDLASGIADPCHPPKTKHSRRRSETRCKPC